MEPAPSAASTVPPDFKDRRRGLLVFGILEILLGSLCVLLVLLMIVGSELSQRTNPGAFSLRQMVPGMAMYVFAAVILVTLGIGSILVRRWARALLLIVSWSWLGIGLLATIIDLFLFPRMFRQMNLPPEARLAALIVGALLLGVFFVAIPAVLVFFYQSRHVKATCEANDPEPSWTDRCPLPVLGFSLWLWAGGLTLLLIPIAGMGVLPVFGRLLTGMPGAIGFVILAAIYIALGWAVYRRLPSGWWITMGLLCLFGVSGYMTFTRINLVDLYRAMGYSRQQLDMLQQYSAMSSSAMAALSLAGIVPFIAFLLFVKRYFRKPAMDPG